MLNKRRQKYRQGDIYWYDFGPEEVEGVQGGLHPCVVISNDLFNKYSPVVNILVVSSQKKNSPVHVLAPSCLKEQDNYIYCEQWATANKRKLLKYVGKLEDEVLEVVVAKLVYHITHRSKVKGKWTIK